MSCEKERKKSKTETTLWLHFLFSFANIIIQQHIHTVTISFFLFYYYYLFPDHGLGILKYIVSLNLSYNKLSKKQKTTISIRLSICNADCIHTSQQCCCIQQCISKCAFWSRFCSQWRFRTFILMAGVNFPK